MKDKIRVYYRLRPLSEKEIVEKSWREFLTTTDEFTVEYPWKDDKLKQYIYDQVFYVYATQESVFEDTKASHLLYLLTWLLGQLVAKLIKHVLSSVVVVIFGCYHQNVC